MRKLIFAAFFFCLLNLNAQAPEKWTSSQIYEHIEKLNFLGSVLYIAAHPDDENTRLISYFSNKENARAAYLSLTRGDGGQNLIGPELREKLGVIRTQELLAARRIDGGQQFFTRANDFGYSKTPSETLEIWNKDEVLSDVVWVIRKFQPDVIINRFDHRTPGSTHGHHTSSAILSVEAFDLVNDKNAYPEQLKFVDAYQPKRLFFNTSPWFYGGDEEFEKADKSKMLSFDTGTYFPQKGLSNPEIAALSRSKHKSQGFGSSGSRGTQMEYLELLKGEMPSAEGDIFAGINTSWSRIEGGEEIGKILKSVQDTYDYSDPQKSIPELLKAYQQIQKLKNGHWKEIKTQEIKDIIYAAAGLYFEAAAESSSVNPGENVQVRLEAINRSDQNIILNEINIQPGNANLKPNKTLKFNEDFNENLNYPIPEEISYTNPYWLNEPGTTGMYAVKDQKLIGQPENPSATNAIFRVTINRIPISFEKLIVYKFNDNVFGETYQSFNIVPSLAISFNEDLLIFSNGDAKEILVNLTSNQANTKGNLKLKAKTGWNIAPISQEFSIAQAGGSMALKFKVTPPKDQNQTDLLAEAEVNGKTYSSSVSEINYDHIPNQNLITPAKLNLVKLNITKKGQNIGYIEGAGDVVPESLEQIGYKVTKIQPSSISLQQLKKFDAVVMGIRAYNVVDELQYKQSILLEYTKQGGTLIIQYNTNRGLVTNELAPFSLNLSRDRVTEEDAKVTFLAPEHPILNIPNKLTQKDFKGWVQERGLYFPDSWSQEFTPILSMHDKDEPVRNGSLLVAPYGEGYFIYTGISFFRQFPEAVPGAFRLFANMLSIGK
ncbi:PIG-L family deacetylase [Gramella sp. AN32]|uniref:PIG-L family deacetylase n=1 Tax=Christiangramia antarctica TaxID=2058158 RepID=A0ABW5X6Q7_9FLAO|nr:PIG-L family deacetylase [Gramella sp. AN32]MCM4156046.1 LmbE family protein [Gramella sp. AN32]